MALYFCKSGNKVANDPKFNLFYNNNYTNVFCKQQKYNSCADKNTNNHLRGSNDAPLLSRLPIQQPTNKNTPVKQEEEECINWTIKEIVKKLEGFLLSPVKENNYKSQHLINNIKTSQPYFEKHLARLSKMEVSNCKIYNSNKCKQDGIILKMFKAEDMKKNLKSIRYRTQSVVKKKRFLMKTYRIGNKKYKFCVNYKRLMSMSPFVKRKDTSLQNVKFSNFHPGFLYNNTQKRWYHKIMMNRMRKLESEENEAADININKNNREEIIINTNNTFLNHITRTYISSSDIVAGIRSPSNSEESLINKKGDLFTNEASCFDGYFEASQSDMSDDSNKAVENRIDGDFSPSNQLIKNPSTDCDTPRASIRKNLYKKHNSNSSLIPLNDKICFDKSKTLFKAIVREYSVANLNENIQLRRKENDDILRSIVVNSYENNDSLTEKLLQDKIYKPNDNQYEILTTSDLGENFKTLQLHDNLNEDMKEFIIDKDLSSKNKSLELIEKLNDKEHERIIFNESKDLSTDKALTHTERGKDPLHHKNEWKLRTNDSNELNAFNTNDIESLNEISVQNGTELNDKSLNHDGNFVRGSDDDDTHAFDSEENNGLIETTTSDIPDYDKPMELETLSNTKLQNGPDMFVDYFKSVTDRNNVLLQNESDDQNNQIEIQSPGYANERVESNVSENVSKSLLLKLNNYPLVEKLNQIKSFHDKEYDIKDRKTNFETTKFQTIQKDNYYKDEDIYKSPETSKHLNAKQFYFENGEIKRNKFESPKIETRNNLNTNNIIEFNDELQFEPPIKEHENSLVKNESLNIDDNTNQLLENTFSNSYGSIKSNSKDILSNFNKRINESKSFYDYTHNYPKNKMKENYNLKTKEYNNTLETNYKRIEPINGQSIKEITSVTKPKKNPLELVKIFDNSSKIKYVPERKSSKRKDLKDFENFFGTNVNSGNYKSYNGNNWYEDMSYSEYKMGGVENQNTFYNNSELFTRESNVGPENCKKVSSIDLINMLKNSDNVTMKKKIKELQGRGVKSEQKYQEHEKLEKNQADMKEFNVFKWHSQTEYKNLMTNRSSEQQSNKKTPKMLNNINYNNVRQIKNDIPSYLNESLVLQDFSSKLQSNRKKLDELKLRIENHKNKLHEVKYGAGTFARDKMYYDFRVKIEPNERFEDSANKIRMSKISSNSTEPFGTRPDKGQRDHLFKTFHTKFKESNSFAWRNDHESYNTTLNHPTPSKSKHYKKRSTSTGENKTTVKISNLMTNPDRQSMIKPKSYTNRYVHSGNSQEWNYNVTTPAKNSSSSNSQNVLNSFSTTFSETLLVKSKKMMDLNRERKVNSTESFGKYNDPVNKVKSYLSISTPYRSDIGSIVKKISSTNVMDLLSDIKNKAYDLFNSKKFFDDRKNSDAGILSNNTKTFHTESKFHNQSNEMKESKKYKIQTKAHPKETNEKTMYQPAKDFNDLKSYGKSKRSEPLLASKSSSMSTTIRVKPNFYKNKEIEKLNLDENKNSLLERNGLINNGSTKIQNENKEFRNLNRNYFSRRSNIFRDNHTNETTTHASNHVTPSDDYNDSRTNDFINNKNILRNRFDTLNNGRKPVNILQDNSYFTRSSRDQWKEYLMRSSESSESGMNKDAKYFKQKNQNTLRYSNNQARKEAYEIVNYSKIDRPKKYKTQKHSGINLVQTKSQATQTTNPTFDLQWRVENNYYT